MPLNLVGALKAQWKRLSMLALKPTIDTYTMDAPALLPCPFCGGRASLRDSTEEGVFGECDSCEARGPCIEVERVGYPKSMFTTISVAPNEGTDKPLLMLKRVGGFNDEYYKLKKQATQKAETAAATAWNQRITVDSMDLDAIAP